MTAIFVNSIGGRRTLLLEAIGSVGHQPTKDEKQPAAARHVTTD